MVTKVFVTVTNHFLQCISYLRSVATDSVVFRIDHTQYKRCI